MTASKRLAIILSTLVTSCWGPPREATFSVSPPLSAAQVRGDELFVQLSSDIRLSMIVQVPTEPLRPGMTLVDARAELGEPVATRRETDTVYYTYGQGPNQVELVHYSGSGEGWFVTVTPADNAVTKVFAPSVQELISRTTGVRRITIKEQAGRGVGFTGDLHEGRVFRLQWHPADG